MAGHWQPKPRDPLSFEAVVAAVGQRHRPRTIGNETVASDGDVAAVAQMKEDADEVGELETRRLAECGSPDAPPVTLLVLGDRLKDPDLDRAQVIQRGDW